MAMHLRCDQYFVEDESWHEAVVPESFGKRAIGIGGDMKKDVNDIGADCDSTASNVLHEEAGQDERLDYLPCYL